MRFVEFKNIQRKMLTEDARIQHAEDFLFYDGSAGAIRVLNSLEKLEKGVEDVTLKWDGSPAIIFDAMMMEESYSQTNQDSQQKDTMEKQQQEMMYKKCLWPAPAHVTIQKDTNN